MSEGDGTIRFVIEDDFHAERIGEPYTFLGEAVAELRRFGALPWDSAPNRAPCVGWDACGRDYWLIEVEGDVDWRCRRRLFVMQMGSAGAHWMVPRDEIEDRFASLPVEAET